MVCTRSDNIKIVEVRNAKKILSKIIENTNNYHLKRHLINLENIMADISKVKYEIKSILRIISDSFDYNDREVKIILDYIDYLEEIYKI